MNILAKLTADELAATSVVVNNAISPVATGDGSVHSLVGQAVILQGSLISIAPQLQKIGVNDLAGGFLIWFNSEVAKAQAALSPKDA